MTKLVGAKRIARRLTELAGSEVSARQVYHLAKREDSPIHRKKQGRGIVASVNALERWWDSFNTCQTRRLLIPSPVGEHRAMPKELRIVGIVGEGHLQTDNFLSWAADLSQGEDVRMVVNSNGGMVSDGLAIYHELRTHQGRVEADIIGVAASMAGVIALAADHIRMAEDALFMLHDPWSGKVGNAEDLRAAADMLEKHGESLAGIYSRRTGISEAKIQDMMGRDNGAGTWLNAEEALELGFIDEILIPAEARLPDIPAAALAKRITTPQGDKTMKSKLATVILTAIKAMSGKRDDIVKAMSEASGMEVKALKQLLDDKIKADEFEVSASQLQSFADELDVTAEDLTAAAEEDGIELEDEPEGGEKATGRHNVRGQTDFTAAAEAAAQKVREEERKREKAIRGEAVKAGLKTEKVEQIVRESNDLSDARARIIKAWSDGDCNIQSHIATVTEDQRDKYIRGMSDWLLVKSGCAGMVESHSRILKDRGLVEAAHRPDPGEFRGFRLLDIARDCLERDGVNLRGMTPMEIARAAVMPRGDAGFGTRSDFPILLENVLHRMLQAAYETAATQWRNIAAVGSVQDFRAHPRLRLGSLARLETLQENGEFRTANFPDAEKETIKADTFGYLVGLSRQAIVNDDLDGFSRMVTMLGQATARSIEIDVFNLFKENSGLGPTMQDGNPLFDASHNNISATGGAPSVTLLEEARVTMAQQKDPNDNDFLDLRPDVFVGPIGKGAAARTAVNAEFDFDAGGTNPKFMKPNIVRDLLSTIVDTPRLTGDRYYVLANPSVAPVIEVAFLQGEESPVIESEEPFKFDGVQWKVRHDYGAGATDFRGAVTNPGV